MNTRTVFGVSYKQNNFTVVNMKTVQVVRRRCGGIPNISNAKLLSTCQSNFSGWLDIGVSLNPLKNNRNVYKYTSRISGAVLGSGDVNVALSINGRNKISGLLVPSKCDFHTQSTLFYPTGGNNQSKEKREANILIFITGLFAVFIVWASFYMKTEGQFDKVTVPHHTGE